MTKRMRTTLAAAAVVSVLAAAGAQAMDSVVLKVDVPFDFVVANRQLPSGEYRIARVQGTSLVRIYSKDQTRVVATFYSPASLDTQQVEGLTFHRHGSQHFLKTIRTSDGFGAYLADSRSEKEAKAAGAAATGKS